MLEADVPQRVGRHLHGLQRQRTIREIERAHGDGRCRMRVAHADLQHVQRLGRHAELAAADVQAVDLRRGNGHVDRIVRPCACGETPRTARAAGPCAGVTRQRRPSGTMLLLRSASKRFVTSSSLSCGAMSFPGTPVGALGISGAISSSNVRDGMPGMTSHLPRRLRRQRELGEEEIAHERLGGEQRVPVLPQRRGASDRSRRPS